MTDRLEPISETELRVLRVLWEQGPGTVRQVNEKLPHWAYTTVQTLLARLERKGYVDCDRSGFAHVFRALVSRDELMRRRLSELAQQLSDGAATPLVLALVEDHRFSSEEIEQFRRLLDRLEADEREPPKRKSRGTGKQQSGGL
jgi:predicted transcriptional regulator